MLACYRSNVLLSACKIRVCNIKKSTTQTNWLRSIPKFIFEWKYKHAAFTLSNGRKKVIANGTLWFPFLHIAHWNTSFTRPKLMQYRQLQRYITLCTFDKIYFSPTYHNCVKSHRLGRSSIASLIFQDFSATSQYFGQNQHY